MKKLLFAAGMLLGFIGFALLWQKGVQTQAEEMASQCKKAAHALINEDGERALNAIEECEARFHKVKSSWTVMMDHEIVDEMEESLVKAKSFCTMGDYTRCYSEILSLRHRLYEIPKRYEITAGNIL